MFTFKDLMRKLREFRYPREKMQDPKMQTRFDYSQGPMYYLGQQIVSEMQKAGYPSKIVYGYRSPELQNKLYAQGRTAPGAIVTRAKAYQSPHNFHAAVDICHRQRGWKVGKDYWEALNACVKIIERRHGVDLVHGHDWDEDGVPAYMDKDERLWDAAHVELKDWRDIRDAQKWQGFYNMGAGDLWFLFERYLPDKAKYIIRANRVPDGVNASRVGAGLSK